LARRTRRSESNSLHIHHIYSFRYLRLNLRTGHQTGSCVFLQCRYQLNPSLPVLLHLAQLHLMNIRPLLISLESFVLQMLRQNLERILIVKIGIALTFFPHSCSEPNFPILQGNSPRLTGKLVSDAALHILFHLVKRSRPQYVRRSGSLSRRSRLKSLVECYHWFNV
jgi:hypothetical protein